MRTGIWIAAAFTLLSTTGAQAVPAESCWGGRAICQRACTPERIRDYHAGSERRCTASCGPRFQKCLVTGTWVHLEDEHPGWHERVSRP